MRASSHSNTLLRKVGSEVIIHEMGSKEERVRDARRFEERMK